MVRVESVTIGLALTGVVLTLQGCGGGGGGGDSPTPAPAPGPKPLRPLKPMRGIGYDPLPCNEKDVTAGTCDPLQVPLPSTDMAQEGYAAQWATSGRDDLSIVSQLGANAVRLYDAFGLETHHDHSKFLDAAMARGLRVLPGFFPPESCPNFNCFAAWKYSANKGFKQGFKQGKGYHAAVPLVILMDQPDLLNFGGAPVCGQDDAAQAKCRVRAALSALDGFLAAEKEAGITDTSTKLAIAWSPAIRASIDPTYKPTPDGTDPIGSYGFMDMKVGVADPSKADYVLQGVTQKELQDAFDKRWVNAINSASPWGFIQEKVADVYDKYFKNTPWFIAEFRGDPNDQSAQALKNDFVSMENLAKEEGSSFMGFSYSQFQFDYTKPGNQYGIFGLGTEKKWTTSQVCKEDVRIHTPTCSAWPVYCLDDSDKTYQARTQGITEAWGGSVAGNGLCKSAEDEISV